MKGGGNKRRKGSRRLSAKGNRIYRGGAEYSSTDTGGSLKFAKDNVEMPEGEDLELLKTTYKSGINTPFETDDLAKYINHTKTQSSNVAEGVVQGLLGQAVTQGVAQGVAQRLPDKLPAGTELSAEPEDLSVNDSNRADGSTPDGPEKGHVVDDDHADRDGSPANKLVFSKGTFNGTFDVTIGDNDEVTVTNVEPSKKISGGRRSRTNNRRKSKNSHNRKRKSKKRGGQ